MHLAGNICIKFSVPCYKNTVYNKIQIPMDSIKIIYNPDLSEFEIKIISIYKYTMWQFRNGKVKILIKSRFVQMINFYFLI